MATDWCSEPVKEVGGYRLIWLRTKQQARKDERNFHLSVLKTSLAAAFLEKKRDINKTKKM